MLDVERLDTAQRGFQVVQLFLEFGMLLGHLFVLAFPFVSGLLKSLDFAFVMAGLDIGLSESVEC